MSGAHGGPSATIRSRLFLLGTIALAGLAGSLAVWDPLVIDEERHLRRFVIHSANSVRSDLAAEFESRILAQVRLARLWESRQSLSREEWETHAGLFLHHHAGDFAVLWIDSADRLQWYVTHHDRGAQVDLSTNEQFRELVRRGAERAVAVVLPAFQLPDGRVAGAVMVPVRRKEAFLGVLVAVFDARLAFDAMLADHRELGYGVSVWQAGDEIYTTPGTSREYERAWAHSMDLETGGMSWRIRVWPDRDMLSEIRSSLPELALVLGGLLGCLLMITLRCWRDARRTTAELRKARDELEDRVVQRTAELQRANNELETEVAQRKHTEDSLRQLSGRLLQLQDEERRHIARELHDSTAQMVGAVTINVDIAQRLAKQGEGPRLLALLDDSAELLRRVTLEIRTVSYLLHPPILDDLGLEYALSWYIQGFSKRSGVAVDVSVQPDLGRLPRDIELTLFRITQEALTNVHRHSGSRRAGLVLTRSALSVCLEVTDSGCGIPPGVLESGSGSIGQLGVGIAGMRERVRQLGGRLVILNDGGTLIRTVLPLASPATSATAAVAAGALMPSSPAPHRTARARGPRAGSQMATG